MQFSLDDFVTHPEGAHPLAVDAHAGVALLDLHLLVFARRWRYSSFHEGVQIGCLKSIHYGSEQPRMSHHLSHLLSHELGSD